MSRVESRPVPAEPGTVRVEAEVNAPPEQTRLALSELERVRMWFADLSVPLRPGGSARLDFGDGDFFMIDDVVSRGPKDLSYRWRFLGTGPSNTITWTIEPQPLGCRITVADRQPTRLWAESQELAEGWIDFLKRLERYLATGQNTRYDWRRDFEGTLDLPSQDLSRVRRLLCSEMLGLWLPFRGSDLRAQGMITMMDAQQPDRLVLSAVAWDGRDRLRFNLKADEWEEPTVCRIELLAFEGGARLTPHHDGWDRIGLADLDCLKQRRRFAEQWVESLQRARAAIVSSIGPNHAA